jgi:hypothetical protein
MDVLAWDRPGLGPGLTSFGCSRHPLDWGRPRDSYEIRDEIRDIHRTAQGKTWMSYSRPTLVLLSSYSRPAVAPELVLPVSDALRQNQKRSPPGDYRRCSISG